MRDYTRFYDVILPIFATSEASSDETNFPPRSLILFSSLQSAAADCIALNRHDWDHVEIFAFCYSYEQLCSNLNNQTTEQLSH